MSIAEGSFQEADNAPLATTGFLRQPISAGVAVGVILFALVNLADVFSTLYATSFGAEELNPLMDIVLAQGPFSFLTTKYLLGVLGVILIGSYCRQHRTARVALFYVLLPTYLVVVAYNLILISRNC